MEPDRDSGGQAAPVVNSSEKSVVVVHSTMNLPKAREAASHMGLDKAFTKGFESPRNRRQKLYSNI